MSRKITDDFLREIAKRYEEHLGTRKPNAVLASLYGVSYGTAARWSGVARQRGFLAPTRKGKASGEPEPAKHRAVRAAELRQAIEIAHEEGHRLEAEVGIEAAQGARCVARLLRRRAEEMDSTTA